MEIGREAKILSMPAITPETLEKAHATELETDVLSICRRLLRTDSFGPMDNFFDAGGDSLLAMTMLLEVEQRTGLVVAPDKIFQALTVREFCQSLKTKNHQIADDSMQVGPVVIRPVRSGTSRNTLYFVHAFAAPAVIEGLSPELSIATIAIHDAKWLRRVLSDKDMLGTIERISNAYAQAISKHHNAGSCYLAGESFSGVLAIETALKLEECGMVPQLVFLFDTYLHRGLHRILYNILHNGLLAQKLNERGAYLKFARKTWLRLKQPLFRAPPAESTSALQMEELGPLLNGLRAHASEAYRGPSRALAANTVLFCATTTADGRPIKLDPDLGWARPLADKLAVITVPGDHYNMLKGDHANHIAREINKFIASHGAAA